MRRRFRVLLVVLFLLAFNLFFGQHAIASYTRLEPITGGDIKSPVKIALDSEGRIYVTEPSENRLLIYSRNGAYINSIRGIDKPLGVAVDNSGRIYVGAGWEWYGEPKGYVSVYNPDLTFSHKLGSGNGEFVKPASIAIGNSGDIYVADIGANTVKVYDSAGIFKFNFGTSGSGNGQFNVPIDIEIDDVRGEVLVLDQQVVETPDGPIRGARVQVFDYSGVFKRSFGSYGLEEGKMVRPTGISVDESGNIYVSDSFFWVVHIFDTNGNFIGPLYDPNTPMGTPQGVKIGKDKRVFIACLTGSRIEVYGLSGYTVMTVAPDAISFSAEQGSPNPTSQNIIIANNGEGALHWTAVSDSSWITLSQNGGTTEPFSAFDLSTGVNIAGLEAGTYKGSVTITAESGARDIVTVNLTVVPQPKILSVMPTTLSFKAQKNGTNPPSQAINISNLGSGEMAWTGSASAEWISISSVSGIAPSSVQVNVNSSALDAGTYTGNINISASGAEGSPATVNVSVKVVDAGTVRVTTNLQEAAFDIKGPVNYSGTGTLWSYDEIVPGDYTITFGHVPGYIKPQSRMFTVQSGKEVVIDGQYKIKPVATNIIAGGGSSKNKKVVVLTFEGTPVTSFVPYKSPEGIRVSAGDIDGSGIDRIVMTDRIRTIKIYTAEGVELASMEMARWYKDAEVAVSDIDSDGRADIIISVKDKRVSRREIKLFSYNSGRIEERYTLYRDAGNMAFTIAAGDIDGDGATELIAADKDAVRAFDINLSLEGNKLKKIWEVNIASSTAPEIAAGDIDGDGVAEIALSVEGQVKIFKGTGEDYGLAIAPFTDLGYTRPSTVALGDIDGDGIDEFEIGAGRRESNEPYIRLFDNDGTFTGTTIKAMEGTYGVNVSMGRF